MGFILSQETGTYMTCPLGRIVILIGCTSISTVLMTFSGTFVTFVSGKGKTTICIGPGIFI